MQGIYKLHYYNVDSKNLKYKISPKQHEAILQADRDNVRFVALNGVTQNIAYIYDMVEKVKILNEKDIDEMWSSLGLTEADKKYLHKVDDSKLIGEKDDNRKSKELL